MGNRAEMLLCVLSIIILGLFWWSEVRKNDRHLEAAAHCANAAGEPGTVAWRKAWDACFEATK